MSNHELHDSMLDALDLACVLELDGTLRTCLRAPAGHDIAAAIGAPMASLIAAPDRQRFAAALDAALRTEEPVAVSVRLDVPGTVLELAMKLVWVKALDHVLLIATEASGRDLSPSAEDFGVLEVMERVNAILIGATAFEAALSGVLDVMLDVFDCDRAWLLFPCDPDADSYSVPIERTRPEWPGAAQSDATLPMNQFAQQTFATVLAAPGPVRRDPECTPVDLDDESVKAYSIRSMLTIALRPTGRTPWCLGIHHCREARVYSGELAVFQAIGERVGESLSRLLDGQELERSEQRFKTLLEYAPEAIVILDVQSGMFVDCNANAERLYGWPREELLAKKLEDVCPEYQPNGETSAVAARREVARAVSGEHAVFDWVHINALGQAVPCEVRLVHLPDDQQVLVRGSVTDITSRKQAEQAQRTLLDQLQQAQKMEALGQLTGGVAHDFNNILTVVMGNTELAMDELGAQHESAGLLQEALRASARGAVLTQSLLAFSRKQTLVPQVVAIPSLVRDMEELLVRTLGATISIETVLGAGLWTCEVDASQLENAVLNLAVNARDAMPKGGRLSIEAANRRLDAEYCDVHDDVEPGQYVLLAISDDGKGMSEHVIAQAFDPFFTTKEVGQGSGLGLSMVFGFVRQSRGHVKIYSEVGQGTTVKLYLPRSLQAADHVRLEDPAREDARGNGELILVVEDEVAVREMVVRSLEVLGYRTHQSGSAAEALVVLNSPVHIDLLLTDVVLPGGVNGAELARLAHAVRPGLNVLFTSGYAENAIIHHGHVDPGVELLSKPFTRSALARRVRDAIEPPSS